MYQATSLVGSNGAHVPFMRKHCLLIVYYSLCLPLASFSKGNSTSGCSRHCETIFTVQGSLYRVTRPVTLLIFIVTILTLKFENLHET
jgi:hypothetical protein